MALSNKSPTRANIRIEIKNDFAEKMDEDAPEENELSEGELEDDEISDTKNTEVTQQPAANKIVIRRNIATNHGEVYKIITF